MLEGNLFDHKFIEEVNSIKYLKDKKDYDKMPLPNILNSFLKGSSIMQNNSITYSGIGESSTRMFSKVTSASKVIPEKTLKNLERDPEWRFSAQILLRRRVNKMVTDPETVKKAVLSIQK